MSNLPDEIKSKLQGFMVRGEYQAGLDFLESIKDTYPDNLEIPLQRALHLYHDVINNEEYESGKTIEDYPALAEAERISQKALKKVPEDSKLARNARMYIFQIHSFLQNKDKAYKYAKANWDMHQDAVAANRMRWLSLASNDVKEARKWHDTFMKKGRKEGWKKYHLLSEEIHMLLAEGRNGEAKEKYKELLPLLPDNDEGRSIADMVKADLIEKGLSPGMVRDLD